MAGYWIRVPGHGYFIRFESYTPARWFTTKDRQRAYCFATQQDAEHVADQLRRYGRTVTVVTEAPKKTAPRADRSEQMWENKFRETTLANKAAWDRITKLFALADETRNNNAEERSRAWSKAWGLTLPCQVRRVCTDRFRLYWRRVFDTLRA